ICRRQKRSESSVTAYPCSLQGSAVSSRAIYRRRMKRALRKLLPVTTLLMSLAMLVPEAAQGSPRAGNGPTVVNAPGLPQSGALFGAYIQVDCVWNGCTRQAAQTEVET